MSDPVAGSRGSSDASFGASSEADSERGGRELTGIVLVNYGSHALIEENLAPIGEGFGHLRVIVVDNFSSRAEREAVIRLCTDRDWSLVQSANVGFGTGMNLGVARAQQLGCSVFVLLNPDARADHRTLDSLATIARQEPLTLVGPTIERADGSIWFNGGAVLVAEGRTTTRPGTDATAANGWLTGACIALHERLWTLIGGFDDDYFLYWEDVDLSWRVTRAGGRLTVLGDLVIVHDVGGTQEGTGKSPVYCLYNCRNRLLFAAKHLSRGDRMRWLAGSIGYARAVVLRGGRRAFLGDARRLTWAAVRGTASGGAALIRSLARA